jgi:hypothetical protein
MRTDMRPWYKIVNSAWIACGNWGRSCADRAWISTRSVCSTAKSWLPAFVRQDLRRQGVARHLLAAPERVPLALQDQLIAEALQSNTGSQQRGRRGGQAVDQPLLTVTSFQKATRPRISSAAALGSG